MKIMAIDFGDVRTGIAISDRLGMLVGMTTVLKERDVQVLAGKIARLAAEQEVSALVLGLPKNMDGTEGTRAALCRAFGETLCAVTGLCVTLWDERRTTVDAHRILSDNKVFGTKRKNTVDAVAAALILEGYLASRT